MSNNILPLVSVIIPVYNVEEYLEEAVLSVCKQTYKNLEIILVNDGSTDKSPEICNHLALTDKRIRVIHKENGGLSSARNTGIKSAIGKYLFFIDSDDLIEKETIETLLNNFSNYNDIGIVSSPCFISYDNGIRTIYKQEWNIKTDRIISYNNFCKSTLLQESCHSACCKLYKKELFRNIKFREGKRNEDTLFMFDLSHIMELQKLNMLEIPNHFYLYRVNRDSISRNKQNPLHIDILDNILLMYEETSNNQIKNILLSIYYKELLYFNTVLLRNDLGNNFNRILKDKFYSKLKKCDIIDVYKKTSIKTSLQYLILKIDFNAYIVLHKLFNYIKRKK